MRCLHLLPLYVYVTFKRRYWHVSKGLYEIKPRYELKKEDIDGYRELVNKYRKNEIDASEDQSSVSEVKPVYSALFDGLVDLVEHKGDAAFLIWFIPDNFQKTLLQVHLSTPFFTGLDLNPYGWVRCQRHAESVISSAIWMTESIPWLLRIRRSTHLSPISPWTNVPPMTAYRCHVCKFSRKTVSIPRSKRRFTTWLPM